MSRPEFDDRRDAGRRLAAALEGFRDAKPLILALPRGGVPVAHEIARALGAQLDLVLVRKIGAPGHEEYGIGAIVDGANPQIVVNDEAVRALNLDREYIYGEAKRQLVELERRRQAYRGAAAPVDTLGRTVIVVDDGIATGSTVRAALRGLRKNRPARLVLAVPVAPLDTLQQLAAECDEIICLIKPDNFYAVGAHYRDFSQTSDEEVIALLGETTIPRSEIPGSTST
jgi:putative phosphoribosyl transferase